MVPHSLLAVFCRIAGLTSEKGKTGDLPVTFTRAPGQSLEAAVPVYSTRDGGVGRQDPAAQPKATP